MTLPPSARHPRLSLGNHPTPRPAAPQSPKTQRAHSTPPPAEPARAPQAMPPATALQSPRSFAAPGSLINHPAPRPARPAPTAQPSPASKSNNQGGAR